MGTHKRPSEETWDGKRTNEAEGRTEWSGRREDVLGREGRGEAKQQQQKKSEAPGQRTERWEAAEGGSTSTDGEGKS